MKIFVFIFSYVCFFSSKTAQSKIKFPEDMTIPAVFAFGDSIIDTGNNNYISSLAKCNWRPYGRDFDGGVATGRFSNGKVPVDFIVEELGIKELLPPYLAPLITKDDFFTGVNFASGGAGFDPFTSWLTGAISMEKQLELFIEYKTRLIEIVEEERAKNIIRNSIYIVSASSNDIANIYFHTGIRMFQYNISAYTDFLVTSATFFLEKLYKLGARRILVFGAPPLGCLPSQRTLAGGWERKCNETYNEMSSLFISEMSKSMHRLNHEFRETRKIKEGSTFVLFDAYSLALDMIKNPKKYGFSVVDKGCCGTGLMEVSFFCMGPNPFTCKNTSNYMFWDSYHPTENAYRILIHTLFPNLVPQFPPDNSLY